MNDWSARYEEGYIDADGSVVQLADELHDPSPWTSPDDALRQWSRREDLASSNVASYRNGLQQTDDVRGRPEFAVLGVVAIWRRVSFERARFTDRST